MKNLYLFLFITSLFSCKTDRVKKPANFIPKETMINLLVDMKIADKTKNVKNIHLEKDINYMAYVFNKYQIDSTQFKESNAYYVHYIEDYMAIYEAVEIRLKDSLAKYKAIKHTNDSIAQFKKQANKKELKKSTLAPALSKKMLQKKGKNKRLK